MGESTPVTVLNVIGGGLKGGRYLTDCVGIGRVDDNYYKDSDLAIGKTINVYGRRVILTGCDYSTSDYYRIKVRSTISEFQRVIQMQMLNSSTESKTSHPYQAIV